MKILILAVAVILSGCATGDPGVIALAPEGLCLPQGTPADVLAWPVVDARQVQMKTEEGGLENATLVFHQRGERVIELVWIRGEVAIADHDPKNQTAPVWINSRLIQDLLVKNDAPSGSCRWRLTGDAA